MTFYFDQKNIYFLNIFYVSESTLRAHIAEWLLLLLWLVTNTLNLYLTLSFIKSYKTYADSTFKRASAHVRVNYTRIFEKSDSDQCDQKKII